MNAELWVIVGAFIFALLAVIAGFVRTLESESSNRMRLRVYALKVGMRFTQVSSTLDELSEFGGIFNAGWGPDTGDLRGALSFSGESAPRILNQLDGVVGGRRWKFLDVMVDMGSERHRRRVPHRVLTVHLEECFPELLIQGERGMVDESLGKDIDFESEVFNRKYHVSAENHEFAYGILSPAMVDWLANAPVKRWHLQGNRLTISEVGNLTPNSIELNTGLMLGFLHRVPKYLRDDYGAK